MTDARGRWRLDARPRAQRQLSHLPEKIAMAVAEFITGPLLDNPHHIGHPLHGEYLEERFEGHIESAAVQFGI